MVKVLYINGNIMKRGGIEAFMMNYFRRIDRKSVSIDFLVHGFGKGEYDDEILSAGSKIIHVPQKSKQPIKYANEIKRVFESGEYQVVHSHCDAMSGWILKIAKKAGVKVCLAHSHNTAILSKNWIKLLINEYYKKQIPVYADKMLACSNAAGKWMFGEKSDFLVVPNAIELNKFRYDESARMEIRERFQCGDSFVVGHVGRFDHQKNHHFILLIWKEVIKMNKNCKLLLVGGGDLQGEIQQLAQTYGISDSIIFAGVQENTAKFYSAFDAFILPSHFEGFPVVAIEAQANGLDCILSDKITDEVCLTNTIKMLPIENPLIWAEQLLSLICGDRENKSETSILQIDLCGYGIEEAAIKLQDYYINLAQKTE